MAQNRILYGGDYNPEQWIENPEILQTDATYFKKAYINEATVGIFSWSMLEPEEGKFNLVWLEKIIDYLYKNGISVILATPSAARPKWLADKYPEVLRVNADRTKNLFGGRHNHCLTSPVYREKVGIIDRKLAQHFGKHPAVIAWHLSNELSGECHCPLCQKAFQSWLRKKYGTIDKLNMAWQTCFWSHVYDSFSQVESPSPKGENLLHGLNLDWKRFVTDQTVSFVRDETRAIREAGAVQPTTVNLMYDFKGLNYGKFRNEVDIISWDNYPTWHKEEEYKTALDTAMQHDLMRSIQKKPFLLMESCPSATNWQSVSKLKRPGMLRTASLQAIAHGSDSVLYFQLRQSRGASEKFHGAVIDHYGGDDTRVFAEVKETGKILSMLSGVVGSVTKAQAALLWDTENRWGLEDAHGPRNMGLRNREACLKSYAALRHYNVNVDIIDMDQALDGYRLVAAPMLYMLRADFVKKARDYVEKGGNLVLTYWSGIVDENDLCYLGGTPYGLMDVFGLRSEEIDGLYDGEANSGVPIPGASLAMSRTYSCSNLCELVKLEGAEPLMVYGSDFYAGKAVLTRNRFGKGNAYYVCADFESAFYDEFYAQILKKDGVEPLLSKVPDGVEITTRENETDIWMFVINYKRDSVKIELPVKNAVEIYGYYDGTIGGLDSVVMHIKK